MPRKTRHDKRRPPEHPGYRTWLETGRVVPTEGAFDVFMFASSGNASRQRALWGLHRDTILEDWAREHPGSRPASWWRFDSPEPRRRVGGIGDPAPDHLAYAPTFSFGMPVYWVTQWDVAYYTGRARDIHGQPIGTIFQGRAFAGRGVDPLDRPRFEGQGAYLDRLNLWARGEKRRAPAATWQDEPIPWAEDDGARIDPPTDDEKGPDDEPDPAI